MIPWIIIAAGVVLLFASLREGGKARNSALGAIIIGIGVITLGKSFGWFAIGAGVLGLLFLLISLKALTRILAGAAVIGMLIGGLVSLDTNTSNGDVAKRTGATTTTESTTTTSVPADDLGLTEAEARQIAEEIAGVYEGFAPGEVNTGTGNIPESPEERNPTVTFTKETIETREDLCAFFKSDHRNAPKYLDHVEQALRAAGYGDDEVNTALHGTCDRWIWVAPNVESQILGTTYPLNGDIVKSENWRQVAPNDAIWFYVTTDAHLVQGAAVRADCGNPEVDKVRPVRPETPTAPPIDIPPNENCPFPGKEDLPVDSPLCLQPKDQSRSSLVNPNVPDQGQSPGTTPVGTDLGPATPVCDTPTGYCPGSEPTTTTTQPSGSGGSGSGGGTTTTVPSCGQAGQPACENTGSPPTTEAPPPAPPNTTSPTTVVTSP